MDKSTGLLQQLSEREDLRELRQSPMLLTALCVKYDEGQRLPRDLYLLYHSLINQVLHSRYLDTTDLPAVRRRLAAIALGMHTGDAVRQPRATPEPAVSYDEVERILADYAGVETASEGGADLAAEKRDDLVTRSGLLLPRGEGHAAFYHFSFQEYLAAERLFALDTELAANLRQYAATPEWRRSLLFLFCAVADQRPQAALDAVRTVLLPALTLTALRNNPHPAWLLLNCLEIAHARGWALGAFEAPLRQVCAQSLAPDFPPVARNTLWLSAGQLGFDRRPGVDVDADGLPEIDWCPVAAGRVALEDGAGTFDVPAFAIARHPVTNAQFRAFMAAGDGYRDTRWWDPAWLEAGWVDPSAPRPGRWTEPNAPRETVSWCEAVAFCRWLDHRLRARGGIGTDRQLRLPTEWEWQQAATGGDQRRDFPWAGAWDPAKLNSGERGTGRTTAVGLYPAGVAACGALDLAGNVWEWCLNRYDDAANRAAGPGATRVVRGGSWILVRYLCRAAFRYGLVPNGRLDDIGFRVCLSSAIMNG
ncbi:MAG: hypothetical protein FJ189_01165 [Gammaproteobacteria bacterium]|nr:hypothetical protein [Gammaproteobacteria bacterium]